MKTRQLKIWALCVVATAIASITSVAHATQRYPSTIYYHLYPSFADAGKPAYYPPCSVCHVRGSTGAGTAQTPFALSLKARGLQAKDNVTLTNALDAMQRDGVDSDGDGIPDIQELLDDTDPNTPGDVSLTGESGPNSGCGGGHKANSAGNTPAAAIGLLLLALARRRLRR